jgi:hypothetical protein
MWIHRFCRSEFTRIFKLLAAAEVILAFKLTR